jgi:hypothetical protein
MCCFAPCRPLNPLRQLDLLVGGEQLDAADRAQVQAQRVEAGLDREVELGALRAREFRTHLSLLPKAGSSVPESVFQHVKRLQSH